MLPLLLAAMFGPPFAPATAPTPIEPPGVPSGYHLQVVADRLTFPVDVVFDLAGEPLVLEAGAAGPSRGDPRVLRVDTRGTVSVVASGGFKAPLNDLAFLDDTLFLADDSRVIRIAPDGARGDVEQGVEATGLNAGPDGDLYLDTASCPPAPAQKQSAPAQKQPAAGTQSAAAPQPHAAAQPATAAVATALRTTAVATAAVAAEPCGAVLKLSPNGGQPTVVARGLTALSAAAFAPDGRLFVLGGGRLQALDSQRPAATLPASAQARRFDFSRSDAFGFPGDAFVPEPQSGVILRVDPNDGAARPFLTLSGVHPLAVRFDPAGDGLYVVDEGTMADGVPLAGTGQLLLLTQQPSGEDVQAAGPNPQTAQPAPNQAPSRGVSPGPVTGYSPARRLVPAGPSWRTAAAIAAGIAAAALLLVIAWRVATRHRLR